MSASRGQLLRSLGAPRPWDRLLDLALVLFAAWTVVYQACVLLRVDVEWAAGAWVLAAVASAWLLLRRGERDPDPERGRALPRDEPSPSRSSAPKPVLAAGLAAAVVAAALFAFTDVPWTLIWVLWLVAAGCAAVWATARLKTRPGAATTERADPVDDRRPGWVDTAVVLAWASGLAIFSLFLVAPDRDDTYYVHLSTWIAANGEFPVRDVLFSDRVFPALYYPPLPSWEGLAGTLGRLSGVPAPDILYLAVPPVATFLGVLALWRLLRRWQARMPAVALSVAMVFLLFAATEHRTFGAFFVGRIWQGKVVFLVVLVPLLFALLHEYAERPTTRRLALVACASVAAVGLTTTAIFVVPVIAAGCLAPLALRAPRRAALGAVAAIGYPAAAGVLTLAVGGRTPDEYTDADVVAGNLVHTTLDVGVLALLAMAAVLAGPALIRRASAAQMIAGTVLLVGLLYTPPVPEVIFHATGLGRVLWRLTWALPVAALLGLLATEAVPRSRGPLVRAVPALAICVAVVLAGAPRWETAAIVRSKPSLKRSDVYLTDAREILDVARRGENILAPYAVSQTIMILSGTVTTVNPANLYAGGLRDARAGHAPTRWRLQQFAQSGRFASEAKLRHRLRLIGVDLACVLPDRRRALAALTRAGYVERTRLSRLECRRRPRG